MNRKILKSFCQLNRIFDAIKNPINCDYYDIDEVDIVKTNKTRQDFYILHFNIPSLTSHI